MGERCDTSFYFITDYLFFENYWHLLSLFFPVTLYLSRYICNSDKCQLLSSIITCRRYIYIHSTIHRVWIFKNPWYVYLLYREVYILLDIAHYVFVAHFYFNVFSAFWNIFLWPLNIFITSCRFIVGSKKETDDIGVTILRMYKLVLYHCKSKHQKLYCCLTFVIKKMNVFTNMQR